MMVISQLEYQKKKYEIDLALSKIYEWFTTATEKVSKNEAKEDFSRRWAMKNFDKICLNSYRRNILNENMMPDAQLKRAKELLSDM